MRYSPLLAETVSSAVCSGSESKAGISRRLGLDEKEVAVWCALYLSYGKDVFATPLKYGGSQVKEIVEDYLLSGMSLTQTCVKYKILHRSTLRDWIRHYRQGEPFTMKKSRKRPPEATDEAQARIKQLEQELLYVRAENAFLKKVRALMRQTKGQSGE